MLSLWSRLDAAKTARETKKMDPLSSVGGGAQGIGNQFGGGGVQQSGGPQSPKQILQALLAKLGIGQDQNAGGGGQCACGGACASGGGQACSCGCAQRSNGLGF